MSKVMYLFDHVKRVARDRQVKPVTDKSTASKIFHGLAIGKRDLPTLKKVYGKQAGFFFDRANGSRGYCKSAISYCYPVLPDLC